MNEKDETGLKMIVQVSAVSFSVEKNLFTIRRR